MTSDTDKNTFTALTLVIMAVVCVFLPPAFSLTAGVALGLGVTGFLGLSRGLAALAPLIMIWRVELLPAVYAVTAAIFIADGEKGKESGLLSAAFMASLAGLSYSLIAYQTEALFHSWSWIITASAVTAAVLAFSSRIPAGEALRPAMRSLTAAVTLYALSQMDAGNYIHAESFWAGLALSTALGLAAYMEKKIDKGGLVMGALAGSVIFISLGVGGFIVLFSFIMLAVAATGASARARGLNREDLTRGKWNVAANIGPAAALAAVSLFSDDPYIFNLGFCASLGAALADTISSELGMVYGARPVDVSTFAPAMAGDDGAVTMEGTSLGLLAALFMALASVTAGLADTPGAAIVVFGAAAGFMTDSWLGSVYEKKGFLSNDAVNAWATATGGMTALILGLAFL